MKASIFRAKGFTFIKNIFKNYSKTAMLTTVFATQGQKSPAVQINTTELVVI